MKKENNLKSMTGFGKGSTRSDVSSCFVEIKSVNHRYLEVNTKVPDEFLSLELEIKKIIKQHIKRGSVYLNLNFCYDAGMDIVINDGLFKKLLKLEKEIENRHGISQSLNIHYILSYPGVVKQVRPQVPFKEKRALMLAALNIALKALLKSRDNEGKNLKKDLDIRLNVIERSLAAINGIEKNREKILVKKMQQQAQNTSQPQVPVPSTAEELVRLKSHIKTMRDLIARGGVVGRELDFLAQEMNRETNTVSAKALSSRTARSVVKVKAEIEKIREQSLNIE